MGHPPAERAGQGGTGDRRARRVRRRRPAPHARAPVCRDRKSTRLNSSHANISYAVFCLKKKKTATLAGEKKLSDVELLSRTDISIRDERCIYCLQRRFFFSDPATTEIYTLSLHDALPISGAGMP